MTTQQTEPRRAKQGGRRRGEAVEHNAALVPAATNGHAAHPATAYKLAKGLGWFSIGLGLVELLAPREVARLIGAKGTGRAHTTLRILGLREIVSGVGILSRTRDAKWVWSRLGGDIMDVALLKTELMSSSSDRARGLAAAAVVLGVAAVDGLTALELSRETAASNGAFSHPITVTAAVTINRSASDVYDFWRNFENLSHVLSHVESVRVDGNQSHWRATLAAGLQLEWSAQIEEDKPSELISWRSLPGAVLENHGRVSFRPAPGDRGTEVHVTLGFEPLGGALGAAFAKLLGSVPAQQLRADLKRVKQVLEIGGLMQSDASVHSGPHAARPSRSTAALDDRKVGKR